MNLIIGLGNPGEEYKKTRHNAGFLALDGLVLSSKYQVLSTQLKFNAEISHLVISKRNRSGVRNLRTLLSPIKRSLSRCDSFEMTKDRDILNEKIILAKPQTFMNNSGQSVKAIVDYYKIKPEDIIVIHDDLDILLGKYKISKNKNSGGHKGVQSIIDYLGTKDFMRIRIGIMIENKKTPTEKFVLERFGGEEMEVVEGVIEEVVNEIYK